MTESSGKALVVAIDGPAGVGKSTATRLLALRLGYILVDTGALYRAVALLSSERGVSWDDGPALAELTQSARIELGTTAEGETVLRIEDVDRSRDIRTPQVSKGASDVSRHPEVRAALLELQRSFGADGGVVLEGRDIGTVVFPDAEVKVFLTATPEVRARRRYDELLARGSDVTYEETLQDVLDRDHQDTTRAVAPLKAAADAVVVDSSSMGLEEVVSHLQNLVHRRAESFG